MGKQQIRSLPALKRGAAPIFELPDLVNTIARGEPLSASAAYRLAQQAGATAAQRKAARDLAIIRRDHGDALEAFISEMQQGGTATAAAHAHLDGGSVSTNKSAVDRLIARATSPHAKLTLMLRHARHEDASRLIEAELERTPAVFDWERDHRDTRPILPARPDGHRPDGRCLLIEFRASEDSRESALVLDFAAIGEMLGWDSCKRLEVVRRVLENLASADPSNRNMFWTLNAARHVLHEYLTPEDDLYRRTELACLLAGFREGRLFELRQRFLGLDERRRRERDEVSELNPIVDRLVELGMTMEEVREEFLRWLREKLEPPHSCRSMFLIAVAGARCFRHDDIERTTILRAHRLRAEWEDCVKYGTVINHRGASWGTDKWSGPVGTWRCFTVLGSLGLWETRNVRHLSSAERGTSGPRSALIKNNDRSFFREALAVELSKGRISFVFQVLLHFGLDFGLVDRQEEVAEALASLAPRAFRLAVEAERYGMAAALSQRFEITDKRVLEERAESELEDRLHKLAGCIDWDFAQYGRYEMGETPELEGQLVKWVDDASEEGGHHVPCSDDEIAEHNALLALWEDRGRRIAELVAEAHAEAADMAAMATASDQPIALIDLEYLPITEGRLPRR